MIRDLLLISVERYGGDEELVDRMLAYGEKEYRTWVIRSLADEKAVNRSLWGLAEIIEEPIPIVRYAYFTAPSTPLGELRQLYEYDKVITLLEQIFPNRDLWVAVSKYAYRNLKRLAIEQMLDNGHNAKVICSDLRVSNGLVYDVRRKYNIRQIKEKP